ncbi:hypothetical protein ACFL2M_02380 [Patescibacteria group bacterium]
MAIDKNKIHQHLHSISRINTILAAISLVAVVGLFVWLRWYYVPEQNAEKAQQLAQTQTQEQATATEETEVAEPIDPAELKANYRSDINELLEGFKFDNSTEAETISFQALELRVPAEFKNLHLQVVISLHDAQQGEYEKAQNRIQQMRTQYSWFLPKYSAS